MADVATDMAQAANKLLSSLKPEQKKKAVFNFKSEERTYWHFVPSEMLKGGFRRGLTIRDMTPGQRELTHELLLTVLSEGGHAKAKNIMFLEDILHVLEGKNRRFVRDSKAYHVLIFGTPGTGTWGWRFEGHHLSLNYAIVNGTVKVVPSFWGSNPAVADFGPGRFLITLKNNQRAAGGK